MNVSDVVIVFRCYDSCVHGIFLRDLPGRGKILNAIPERKRTTRKKCCQNFSHTIISPKGSLKIDIDLVFLLTGFLGNVCVNWRICFNVINFLTPAKASFSVQTMA